MVKRMKNKKNAYGMSGDLLRRIIITMRSNPFKTFLTKDFGLGYKSSRVYFITLKALGLIKIVPAIYNIYPRGKEIRIKNKSVHGFRLAKAGKPPEEIIEVKDVLNLIDSRFQNDLSIQSLKDDIIKAAKEKL